MTKRKNKTQPQKNLVALSLRGGKGNVLDILTKLGGDEAAREPVIAALKYIEKNVKLPQDRSIREELSGPMADALFKNAGVLRKELKDGTVFEFLYRSKIARDIILSPDEHPDHVFEPQTTKLFLHLAKGAKHIIIGGAYAGDHAVLGAKAVARSGGTVHGFEPIDEQRRLLERNARLNGVARHIRAVKEGLWERDNVLLELAGDDAFAHARPLRGKAKKGMVVFPATTIAAYAGKNKIKKFDLILMDIEGSELPALKGALPFLKEPAGRAPDIIFEVHRCFVDWSKGLGKTEIVRFLRGLGYHIYAIRDFQSNVPMKGCRVELIKPEDVYLEGPPHGFNMLAVKDPKKIDNKMFRLVKNVSPKLLLHKDPKLHWPTEWL
ncbi:MAG: FkbM family methyltransferase [Alphaproteobacteria bacterium]|nr:FkbM family methyltransferase [Alphaproteobacteria bacterium]